MEDFAEALRGMRSPWDETVGLTVETATRERVTASLVIDPDRHMQPFGLVHGGVYAAIAETLASFGAALSAAPDGKDAAGMENHTSFIRAVTGAGARLTAVAEPIHRGRTTPRLGGSDQRRRGAPGGPQLRPPRDPRPGLSFSSGQGYRRRRSRLAEYALVGGVLLLVFGVLFLLTRPAGSSPRPTAAARPSPSASLKSPTSRPGTGGELTVASIFEHPPDLSKVPAARKVTMIVTGDVIPARNVDYEATQRNDFLWPFRATHDLLHSGDFLYINLEAPLVAGCPARNDHTLTFCGDPRFIDGLVYAGVSVANLSNNHLTNYGQAGSESTVKLLTDNGIQPSGIGLIGHLTVKGVRFAFIGFNGVHGSGAAGVDRTEVKREITEARPTADVVVVQFHWGKEYRLYPEPADIAPDDPKELGRWTIDQGADLVIGNHPHAVQGVEIYKGKLITYAHGNFVFDQMFTPSPDEEDVRNGVVGKYVFVDGKLAGVSYVPVRTFDQSAQVLPSAEAQAVMARMKLSTDMVAGVVTPSP